MIKYKKRLENVVADHLSHLLTESNLEDILDSLPDEQLFGADMLPSLPI